MYGFKDDTYGKGGPITYYKDQSLQFKAQMKLQLGNGRDVPLIKLPKMHLMVANRTKVRGEKTTTVKAFEKMTSECFTTLYNFFKEVRLDSFVVTPIQLAFFSG